MHTTHLSEMTDDASISLTCNLWALVVITISVVCYTVYHKNKETINKNTF